MKNKDLKKLLGIKRENVDNCKHLKLDEAPFTRGKLSCRNCGEIIKK